MGWKTGDPVPTRQEMFDMAVRGLRAQGWKRAEGADGSCRYETQDGRRCAWGHVDSTLTGDVMGVVTTLKIRNVGLAAQLTAYDVQFARKLQSTHDYDMGRPMEQEFRVMADRYNLIFPED